MDGGAWWAAIYGVAQSRTRLKQLSSRSSSSVYVSMLLSPFVPPSPFLGFPGGPAGKESTCNAGGPGSIPGSGRFPWRRDRLPTPVFLGFPCGSAGKASTCNSGDLGSIPGLGRSPGEGKGLPTPIFWPGEFHGLYSPWGHKESDTTEQLSLSPSR